MPVRLRLQRHGRKRRPFYLIVAADSRVKRDGKYIDRVGTYNPTTVPAEIELDGAKALEWLQKGAEPTNTVKAILSYEGVLYKKHLMRGVKKGALSMEDAEAKFEEFMASRTKGKEEKKLSAEKSARAEFEKHEAAAKEKREKEDAEKAAAEAKEREKATTEAKAQETEEAEKPTDIDQVAKEAAGESSTSEEPKAEATEEPKAETTEDPKAEATVEPKAEVTEEAKKTEEPKADESSETKEQKKDDEGDQEEKKKDEQ